MKTKTSVLKHSFIPPTFKLQNYFQYRSVNCFLHGPLLRNHKPITPFNVYVIDLLQIQTLQRKQKKKS